MFVLQHREVDPRLLTREQIRFSITIMFLTDNVATEEDYNNKPGQETGKKLTQASGK